MKTSLHSRTKWILFLTPIVAAGFLIGGYGAMMVERRADAPQAAQAGLSATAQVPDRAPPLGDHDNNPEYISRRREYLDRLFAVTPEGVPSVNYAKALAAARALPPSPLLRGRKFKQAQVPAGEGAEATWTSPIPPPIINSYGGNGSVRIDFFGLDPTDEETVYIGGTGGFAKSNDGGGTWDYLSGAWDSQAVSSISVDPNAPSHVYVATGHNYALYGVGIYRSFNGGTQWEHFVGPFGGTAIRKVAVDPRSSGTEENTTVYVANGRSGTNAGLWRSTDSGETWDLLVSTQPWNGIWDLAIDPITRPSTLYIADSNGVSRSIDDGENWDPIYTAEDNWNNGAVRLSVVNSVPYLLRPTPDAWPNTKHKLYYYSEDVGWTKIQTLCPPPAAGANHCSEGTQISPSVFAVDPFAPGVILIGTNTLYRTTDNGDHWNDIGDLSSIHPDQQGIVFSPFAGVVYSGNDGGVSRSTNHGQINTWENLNQDLSGALLYSVALSEDDTMIAGTQDHGIVFSYNNISGTEDRNWDMIWGGDSVHNLIDPTNSEFAYFTMYGPDTFRRFKKSTRESWDIRPPQFGSPSEPCNFFPTFSMNRSHPGQLMAACQHVVRTWDGTASPAPAWHSIGERFVDVSHVVTAVAEAPSDSNIVYAVEQYGKLWVTENAGTLGVPPALTTWEMRYNPGGISNVTVHPTNPSIAYLACDSGVHKTENKGVTWSPPTGTPGYVYRDVVIDPANTEHLFAASNVGVFSSTNGGASWQDMSDDIPRGMIITGLSFHNTTRQLAASTYGRGVYILNLDDVPPTVSISSPVSNAMLSGTVLVTATAQDNHKVAGVRFRLDGADLGSEDPLAPYHTTWNTTLSSNASHLLEAVAHDAAGNPAVFGVTVTVDNLAPFVSITAPANGATVSGKISVSASASDLGSGVAGVQFQRDGANLGAEDTSSPYSVPWGTSSSSNGPHELRALVRDAAGNTMLSAGVTVNVNN